MTNFISFEKVYSPCCINVSFLSDHSVNNPLKNVMPDVDLNWFNRFIVCIYCINCILRLLEIHTCTWSCVANVLLGGGNIWGICVEKSCIQECNNYVT